MLIEYNKLISMNQKLANNLEKTDLHLKEQKLV